MCTNAGSQLSNQQVTVPDFGTVWFQKDTIANIFGFGDRVDQYQITYDSANEDAFLVHMEDKTVKFTWTPEGLDQFKIPNTYKNYLKKKKETKTETSYMVQTVMRTRLCTPNNRWREQRQQGKYIMLWDH